MTTKKTFGVIVASTTNGGIGKNGNLPWRLPTDMNYFKLLTMGINGINSANTSDNKATKKLNAVIMGRKTWGISFSSSSFSLSSSLPLS
jgi:dihydrofolate reductase/thymidylate synthase